MKAGCADPACFASCPSRLTTCSAMFMRLRAPSSDHGRRQVISAYLSAIMATMNSLLMTPR